MNNQVLKKRFPKKRKLDGKTTHSKDEKDKKQDAQILRLTKMLKKAEPPVKSTYAEGTETPENAWIYMGVNYPAKGDAPDQRIGERIDLKSINIRFLMSDSNTDGFDTLRVVIIQYLDGNTFANFPINYQTNVWLQPTTSYPYLSPFNTQSASTYRVLYDKMYHTNENGQAQFSDNVLITPGQLAVSKYKFDTDDGGSLPGLDRGLILMAVCSDSTSSPNPDFVYTVKFNFTDS